MFYAQTESDHQKLSEFSSICTKYNQKKKEGLIILQKNARYPRLSTSKLRGIKGCEQLINSLCEGLLYEPPFEIIYDIMHQDLGYNQEYDIVYSNKELSFINLSNTIPEYVLQGDEYYIAKLINSKNKVENIKRFIKLAKFELNEINNICHYLVRQGPAFPNHYYCGV